MEDLVTITVDGRNLRAARGALLWEVCKDHGIEIPIFCYHTKLGPIGACRTCLVEQAGVAKGPITACSTPVTDGMVIRTRSPIAQKAQRGIFEFLLANHPLDCPICDRAGECPLQDQTFEFGPGTSRYIEPKRHHVKPITLGPTIELDRERCVLCWRCVRFCSDVAEDNSIILQDRGDHSAVGTFDNHPYVSNFSGNVVELCPVGALTSRKQRFAFRPWELKNRPSICPHCPMGCNINISVRKNDEVIRFLSRDNPEVDDSWLCDRGRFGFEFINTPDRLKSPILRRDGAFHEVSWGEALDFIANKVTTIIDESGPDAVAGIASPRMTNEDLFVFKRFMCDTLGSRLVDHYPRAHIAFSDAILAAQRKLRDAIIPISEINQAKTILLLHADPSERAPVLELRIRQAVNRDGARLVAITAEPIELSKKAGRDIRSPRNQVAAVTQALVKLISEPSGMPPDASVPNDTPTDWQALATQYLSEGPIAIVYDDSFPSSQETAEALAAVSDLVDALSRRMDVGVIPLLDDCNSMGARDLDMFPQAVNGEAENTSVLRALLAADGKVRAAFLLGANVLVDHADEESIRGLSRLDLLVMHELVPTKTAQYADVVLPAASFAEKSGTFTNLERRVQSLSAALPSPGMARPDWQILADLSQYFDQPLDYSSIDDIWKDMRMKVPAFSDLDLHEIRGYGVSLASRPPREVAAQR